MRVVSDKPKERWCYEMTIFLTNFLPYKNIKFGMATSFWQICSMVLQSKNRLTTARPGEDYLKCI